MHSVEPGYSALQCALAHAAVEVNGWATAPGEGLLRQVRCVVDRAGRIRRGLQEESACGSNVAFAGIARRRGAQRRVAEKYVIGDGRECTPKRTTTTNFVQLFKPKNFLNTQTPWRSFSSKTSLQCIFEGMRERAK